MRKETSVLASDKDAAKFQEWRRLPLRDIVLRLSGNARLLARLYWLDLVISAALGFIAVFIACSLSASTHAIVAPNNMDFWFGGDSPRVFANLTDRVSDHSRTNVHPLFSLLIATPTIILIKGFRVPPMYAATLIDIAIPAALTTILLYATLRFIAPIVDSALYTALFLSSATFLFWYSVPETFGWAAVSVLIAALAIVAVPYGRHVPLLIFVSAASLSITVTNWIAGLMATFLSQPRRQAVRCTVYAFAIVAFFTPAQNMLYPSAGKFLNIRNEKTYVVRSSSHVVPRIVSFAVNSVVIPKPKVLSLWVRKGSYISVETADLRAHETIGLIGSVAWLALLLMGSVAIIQRKGPSRLRVGLAVIVLTQLVLFIVYGDEPFLYAAIYVPLLVLIAAFTSRTRMRRLALGLGLVVITAGGLNNIRMFRYAANLIPGTIPSSQLQTLRK